MKEGVRVLVALLVAFLAGLAVAASGSAPLLRAVDLIAPLGALWVTAIRMTILPLMVSLLIAGVASASDVHAIGRLGARTLLVFVLLLAGMAAVIMPLATAVFALGPHASSDPAARPPLPAGAAEAASSLDASQGALGFSAWVGSLLPANPVQAAASGAVLPLILFTLLFALAIAKSSPATRDVLLAFFRALADAMQVLVRWIVALAPFGVFALILPLAARGGAGLAGVVGFYVVAYSLLTVVCIALLYLVAAAFGRVSVRRFARAALPAQAIAFSSSSSLASLPALVESAEDLGLPERVTGFVLPLAVSTFKAAAPVTWTCGALAVAAFYGIPLHIGALATIAFAAVFLSFAVPGVPRGGFLMLTPLFVAIGLPPEGIGILIAVDVIPDLFATVLNTMGDLTAAVLIGRGGSGAAEVS